MSILILSCFYNIYVQIIKNLCIHVCVICVTYIVKWPVYKGVRQQCLYDSYTSVPQWTYMARCPLYTNNCR